MRSLSGDLREAVKRPGLPQAKAAAKKFSGNWPADKIDVSADTVTIWADEDELDISKAEQIGKRVADALGAPSTVTAGNKVVVWYRRPRMDRGD